jgi:RNA polymerase sigma factor (sigma-70 family)
LAGTLPPELVLLLAASTAAERDAAWTAFLATYSAVLLRVARSLGGDQDAAMDRYAFVIEQLALDDLRRLRAYDRPEAGEFDLWLIVVARRLGLDHHRRRYGRSRGAPSTPGDDRQTRKRLADLISEQLDPAELADGGAPGPDDRVLRAERDGKLNAALEDLEPRDQLLLRLRFREDLSAREIAGLMRYPSPFHVYRRLDSVLSRLRSTLRAQGMDTPGG